VRAPPGRCTDFQTERPRRFLRACGARVEDGKQAVTGYEGFSISIVGKYFDFLFKVVSLQRSAAPTVLIQSLRSPIGESGKLTCAFEPCAPGHQTDSRSDNGSAPPARKTGTRGADVRRRVVFVPPRSRPRHRDPHDPALSSA